MQVRVDWVLRIFGTQVIKEKRPVRPVFPDYPFLMTMFVGCKYWPLNRLIMTCSTEILVCETNLTLLLTDQVWHSKNQ